MKIIINRHEIKLTVLCGLFLALGVIFPTMFHFIGLTGSKIFLPMHIPVLLCGLVCGWRYGGICGLLVPYLSTLFSGMPPLFPVAVSMSLELAAYGIIAGVAGKRTNVFFALIIAMLCGRVVMGLANTLLIGLGGYGFQIFLTDAFVTCLPGIGIQLAVIPAVVLTLKKLRLMPVKAQTSQSQKSSVTYDTAKEKLMTLPHGSKVAIDGMSCSGKTMLSAMLETELNCCVVHVDDFFLPNERQTTEIGGNINFHALNEVIAKLGTDFSYNAFDCELQDSSPRQAFKAQLYIVEGTYASHKLVKTNFDYIISLKVDEKLQLKRLNERVKDKKQAASFVTKWLPREFMYLQSDFCRKADLTIETN